MQRANAFTDGFRTPAELAGLPRESSVLLAFSGGADSRALLHLLAEASRRDGFSLLLAHVEHGIRGEDSLRDRDFCVATAAQYGVEICVRSVDVPALAAESGRSLEEEARRVRYEFLAELMRERQIPLLATAHHADDQLETLLFRIARGTTLRGLGGIAPCRAFGTGFLTRPLLSHTKAELLAFCEAQGLEFVRDRTNDDLTYARNRLRAEVVPVLETLFSEPQRRAGELCEALREDETLLASMTEAFLREHADARGLPIEALRAAHGAIRRRALGEWLFASIGRYPERVHLQALLALCDRPSSGARIALPGDFAVTAEAGFLTLSRGRRRTSGEAFRIPLTEGETRFPGGCFRAEVLRTEQKTDSNHRTVKQNPKVNNLSIASSINLRIKCDIIKSELYWRPRQEGDVILMGGMHRKLRRLAAQAEMPWRLREQLPLLCDAEGIVWAPFLGVRDGALAAEDECVLRLTVVNTEQESNGSHVSRS